MPSLFMAIWAVAAGRVTGNTTSKAMLIGAAILLIALCLVH